MIKVFLSHQQADSQLAGQIARYLHINHNIDCYLDLIDVTLKRGEDLADHIRDEMSKCTQLLAVVSNATLASQWVPWEIGVATEKSYPLATYLGEAAKVPEFLRKWPYLQNNVDLDRYASASKEARSNFTRRRSTLNESVEATRASSTRQFYATIRRSLGQL